MPKKLRSGQMAERLGLSKNKLLELARSGAVPSLCLPSGHRRFDEQDVLDALKADSKEARHDD